MEQISYSLLSNLAEKYGTPFYMMFPDVYKANLSNLLNAFTKYYDKVLIGYSFKTNYVPSLCKIAKELGCYAEVVSEMEYRLAQKIGFTHIIFNGPIKPKHILLEALQNHHIVNLDSMYEIEEVCAYKQQHPDVDVQVGLRINIALIDEEGHSKIQNGLRKGRFGFSSTDLKVVISKLRENHIHIISIHGHTSSSDRAVINYLTIVQQMLKVCELYDLTDLSFFDIGGGFFGAAPRGFDLSDKPTYADYANLICDTLLQSAWFRKILPSVVLEPGVSVVANVFSYVSKIYQKKQICDKTFITTDGTVFDVKPTMHTNNLPFKIFSRYESSQNIVCDIVGSTCMEKDVLLKDVYVPSNIQSGDLLYIDGVGAYTIVMTPTFINFLSPILSVEDSVQIVRRRQELNDLLNLYTL